MNNSPNIKDHPSFGCGQAWFVFMRTDRPGLTIVGALNHWAVFALERLMVKDSQISKSHVCMAVFRDIREVGFWDDRAENMTYIDFMLNIVGSDRLLSDPVIANAWKQSLSNSEKEIVQKKLAKIIEEKNKRESDSYDIRNNPFLSPDGPRAVFASSPLKVVPNLERVRETLEGALCGLGFKRPSVSKFVKSIDNEEMSGPLPNLVRKGVQVLSGNA
jgi:hypothetical protein